MKHGLLALGIALLSACVPPPVVDPHAAGINQQQWVANVPGSVSTAFDVAMRVLTDSAYPIADARKDAGLIKTGLRKASDTQRGMAQVRSMMGGDYPVRLSLLLSPSGSDSTRLTITGDYVLENINKSAAITARDKTWTFVDGIGYAIMHAANPR